MRCIELTVSLILYFRCLCYYKDTHFEAIHNTGMPLKLAQQVVYATTKIHILKQFTTNGMLINVAYMLFMLLQRYTFWSNSQHNTARPSCTSCCLCYYKDTHFEAIHNSRCNNPICNGVVYATTKIHILKQFTTSWEVPPPTLWLFMLLQRYTFWSNSQQILNSYNIK